MFEQPVRESIQRIAATALGTSGPVRSVRDLGGSSRSTVARVEIGDATVVVKQQRVPGRFCAGDVTAFGPAERFWNEVAGLELLSSSEHPVAPRLLGADPSVGIVVVEDLGDRLSLADVLMRGDRSAAEHGLTAWAQVLGTVNATAPDGLHEYEARWASLAGRPAPRRRGMSRLREQWATIIATAGQLGVAARPGLERGLVDALRAAAEEPEPWLAFSTGDPCPDNFLFEDDGVVRVLDLEYSGYRHALTDGAYTMLAFPTCWCVGGIPPDVRRRLQIAYRTALAVGHPNATCDATFDRALAANAIMLTANMVGPALPGALRGQPASALAQNLPTPRQRIVVTLEAIGACTAVEAFVGLGELCRGMALALRRRWGWHERDLPLYPAFAPGEN